MPAFVLLARFGTTFVMISCYIVQVELFPTLFLGTSFGICNFFARLFSIGSPLAAEIPEPIPAVIFCVLAGIGLLASFLIYQEKPEIKNSLTEVEENEYEITTISER